MQFSRLRWPVPLTTMTRSFLFTVLRDTRALPPVPVIIRVLFRAGVGEMPASICGLISLDGCKFQM